MDNDDKALRGEIDPSTIIASNNSPLVEKKPDDQSGPSAIEKTEQEGEAERIELDGKKQFYELRKEWSQSLTGWISALLLFQMSIAFLIGGKILDFREYQWFLPLVVIQNFLQIAGMGFIIVKFLYPGTDTKPPN